MTLTPCRECGQQVSTEAPSCPHCGVPDPTRGFAEAEAAALEQSQLEDLKNKLDKAAPGGGEWAEWIRDQFRAGRRREKIVEHLGQKGVHPSDANIIGHAAEHHLSQTPTPNAPSEWTKLEGQLDAIAPSGGKLALRIKQNIEAGRGQIQTIKDIRDQDRSLGLRAAKKMHEVVEAHLRYAAPRQSAERHFPPKTRGPTERSTSREKTEPTYKVQRNRPAKNRTPLIVAAFLVPVAIVVLVSSMTDEPKPAVDRRAVYWELSSVQDRGYCEGKRLYPNDVQRQAVHMDKTSREAYRTVARKYNITEQAINQIAVDGTRAMWLIPDSPCD